MERSKPFASVEDIIKKALQKYCNPLENAWKINIADYRMVSIGDNWIVVLQKII